MNGDSYYPLNHDFKLGKVNDDNNEATISVELDENGDKGYSFRVRMKEKYSEKNIDLLIIMVILNFLSIFLICVSLIIDYIILIREK